MRGGILVVLLWLLAAFPSQAAETRPFVKGTYAELVKAHAGRPLVVHFWSLTCAPCLADLPQWPKLQKRLSFDLVLVSTDPHNQAPALAARLKRAGLADFPSYAFADSFTERLMFEAAPDWRGELPRTHLISAAGDTTAILGTVDEMILRDKLHRH
ncbi:thiol-disulfide isomerase [Paramagnetospirillum kuznetsovii]|uniref:Thiol-disulfide isomerase n=1 Tax=Paramagnetospirillum kuznetsovii TaxID=2053833 RepID=A0A364NZU4_9PROT|nr:TlpA family protein disulfide reductase [Paramagnetospirillum kuznetsovii]RAU22395.1 thiol-disulfide isomerase [Paramagnetospirillum kuznetsovii]